MTCPCATIINQFVGGGHNENVLKIAKYKGM